MQTCNEDSFVGIACSVQKRWPKLHVLNIRLPACLTGMNATLARFLIQICRPHASCPKGIKEQVSASAVQVQVFVPGHCSALHKFAANLHAMHM